MSKLIIAAVLALAATNAAAEPLPVHLKDGASWTLTVDHTRENERGGKTNSTSMKSVLKVTWVDGAKGADVLRMEQLSVTPGAGSPPDVARAADLTIPVILEVDETLKPQRVVNIEELRKSMEAQLARLGAGQPPDAAGKFLATLTDAAITAMATQDVAQLALVQGSDLEVGKEVAYEDEMPNPLGGETTIKISGAFRLESLDRKAGRAVIAWRQAFDPESASRGVAEVVERILRDVDPEKSGAARAALRGMKLERADECRYEIDASSGLVSRADCTTRIVAGLENQSGRRTDRRIYTQTKPEPR